MILKLAWRNIWRNKRRTFITIASIFFAVVFSVFMNSMQKGAWSRMMDSVINFYYGYLQVQQVDYPEEKTLDNSLAIESGLLQRLEADQNVEKAVPRLESFALASHGTHTSGMMIVGTDPAGESQLTNLPSKIVAGTYFSEDDRAVVIAEGVKSLLHIDLGDTIVLISQGYHGALAAGLYPVKGVVKFPSPDLNKKLIYLPLKEAQNFFSTDDRATSIVLKVKNPAAYKKTEQRLLSEIDTAQLTIMNWEQMMPELVEAEKSDAQGNYVFLFILYSIIAFGVFGTILMMTKEREYEFGVLTSIGLRRSTLAFSVWLEVVILGLLGALAGMLGSLPVVWYFKKNPIDFSDFSEEMTAAYEKWGFDALFPTVIDPAIMLNQALIVFVLTAVLATFAIWKIWRLKPVEAMRH